MRLRCDVRFWLAPSSKQLLHALGVALVITQQVLINLFALSQMHHPAAAHRLAIGVPATVEHATASGSGNGGSAQERVKSVAETTQGFITFMDALKLKMRAKDELHPLLSDLMAAYSKTGGSADQEVRGKLLGW